MSRRRAILDMVNPPGQIVNPVGTPHVAAPAPPTESSVTSKQPCVKCGKETIWGVSWCPSCVEKYAGKKPVRIDAALRMLTRDEIREIHSIESPTTREFIEKFCAVNGLTVKILTNRK